MELKEFITQTLNNIVDGIADAQAHALEKQAMINPSCTVRSEETIVYHTVMGPAFTVQVIEFDIAVTVTDEDKSKGGIGVLSAVLNVGVQGEANKINNETSRVKFSIPVVFPLEREEL